MARSANIYARFLKHAFTGDIRLVGLTPPAGLTITPAGTVGTTHYYYKITALSDDGETLPSASAHTTTGNATLSATNYNVVSWSPVAGAKGYRIYGRPATTTAATFKLITTIASATTVTYHDVGVAVGTTTPPAANTTADVLKVALMKATYTPNLSTNEFWSTISADEITGTGYVAGGATLAGVTLTLTPANTWATARASTTTYAVGAVVRPATANGYLYRCTVAGKTGSTIPTFPTALGLTVTDGTVTWSTMGADIIVLKSTPAQWTGATFSADYAVLYAAHVKTGISPLAALQTFGTTQSPTGQTYQVIPTPKLGWFAFSPPS